MTIKKEDRIRNKEIMEENAKNFSKAFWIGVMLFILVSIALLLYPKVIQKSLEGHPKKVAFIPPRKHQALPGVGCPDDFIMLEYWYAVSTRQSLSIQN